MSSHSTQAAPLPERVLPAWAFSILFHSTAIAVLLLAIRPVDHGAAELGSGSMGIVLNPSSADGGLHEGGDGGRSDTPIGTEATPQGEFPPIAVVPRAVPEPPPLLTPAPDTASSITPSKREQLPPNGQSLNVRQVATQSSDENAAQKSPTVAHTKTGRAPGGAGLRGSPGGNGYAQVSVFGVEGKGNKFLYLFDRSSSMEGPPLAAAKRQLLESLKSLDSVHQFHVIFFNTRTQSFDISGGGRRIAFASDRNKQLAANFVGGITADGGTDRVIALREAIGFSPDVIFFLTDSDDPMSTSELADIARLNRRAQTAICVIEFGRRQTPPGENFLKQLARESGGQYGYIDTTTFSK